MTETHIGLLVIGIPALLIGGILLGRYKPVLWFYVVALIVGLGYLTTTGTVDEVGKTAIEYIGTPPAETPTAAPEPTPEPAPSAAPEPTPAPEPAPAPEPTPAPEAPASPTPEATPEPAPDATPEATPETTPQPETAPAP